MNQARKARINSAVFREFGEPVTYRPLKGGDPVETNVILRTDSHSGSQPTAPGFFAEIEVDPSVITDPLKGEEVVWGDGRRYRIAFVRTPPGKNPHVTLHELGAR